MALRRILPHAILLSAVLVLTVKFDSKAGTASCSYISEESSIYSVDFLARREGGRGDCSAAERKPLVLSEAAQTTENASTPPPLDLNPQSSERACLAAGGLWTLDFNGGHICAAIGSADPAPPTESSQNNLSPRPAIAYLEQQDPLSCAVYGTTTELCNGVAGIWQLGRLALSVEASAKAFELAGIGFSSNDLQAVIFRDGVKAGFNLALVAPTIALLDLASLGPNGPLAENSSAISSLAALSLEALYPGIAQSAGSKLSQMPGIVSTSGHSTFELFANAISGKSLTPLKFDDFLPLRHEKLAGSLPILKLIPGLSVGGTASSGVSASDFLFSHRIDPGMSNTMPKGPLEDFPVTLGFTEVLAANPSKLQNSAQSGLNFSKAPFGGGACLMCGDASQNRIGNGGGFQKQLVAASGPAVELGGNSGGHLLDTLSSKDSRISGQAPNANAKTPDDATEKVEKYVGLRALRLGIGAGIGAAAGSELGKQVGKWVAGGPIGAAVGVFMQHERISCDAGEVSKACGNLPDKDSTEPKVKVAEPVTKPENQPKPSPEPAQPKKADTKPEPKKAEPKKDEPKKAEPKTKPSDETGKTLPPGTTESDNRADRTLPDTGMKIQDDGREPKGNIGPKNCGRATFSSISYCANEIYSTDERPCVADKLARVSCYGANVVATSVLREGPLYMIATVDKIARVVTLKGMHQGLLFGDLAQASVAANVDQDRFGLGGFSPIHDGGRGIRPALEILRAQPHDFFKSGFGRESDLVRSGLPNTVAPAAPNFPGNINGIR